MDIEHLIQQAKLAASRAYAPYSRFHVGAAIHTTGGAVFTGCNVENASYGLTCCAERNAIGQMIAAGIQEFDCVVIYTPTTIATAPCGACRQVLYEFSPRAKVVSTCDSDDIIETTVHDLLPNAFGPKNVL